MNRRKFLEAGLLAAAGAKLMSLRGVAAAAPSPQGHVETVTDKRDQIVVTMVDIPESYLMRKYNYGSGLF